MKLLSFALKNHKGLSSGKGYMQHALWQAA